MPKSKRECKDGKVPEGKNGRCIKNKTKTCKPGKAPNGKNGRCISIKKRYVRKVKKASPVARAPSPVVIPSVSSSRSDSVINTAESSSPAYAISNYQARQHINQYMDNIDDPDFLSKKEIATLAEIAYKKQLTESQIYRALDEYHHGRGDFNEVRESKSASKKEDSVTPVPGWYF
jgi:hypothetical protein